MKKIPRVPLIISLTIGLSVIGMTDMAQASPHYGAECTYCHTADQPGALTLTGYTGMLDDLKVFEVEPGGEVDIEINVSNPGDPPFYRTVVRGLDRLNGVDPENGTPQYFPRLYTPDPTWQTKSSSQVQYLFWAGQFYGQGPAFGKAMYSYHLGVGPDVAPGLYDLTAAVAGGFSMRAPGQIPSGGWSYIEDFQLRVVPEPITLVLLITGVAVFFLGRRWRKWTTAIAVVATACLLTADTAQAYPSRAGDCSICHSIPGPSAQTGDFNIMDAMGNPTASFTAEAGGNVEFRFDFTTLAEDPLKPGTVRRGYLKLDKLDLISVAAGPPPAYGDIPYTEPKYTPLNVGHEAGQWGDGHYNYGLHRYFGANGQYFTQSSTDPNASMLFPLTLGADVVPGDYALTATLAGGRPSDPAYLEGWFVTKNFMLTVTPAAPGFASLAAPALGPTSAVMGVPEPSTFLLLASAFPVLWLWVRGRRRRT